MQRLAAAPPYARTHARRSCVAALCARQAHRDANGGALPETVAVNLWGLDAIKTKGESVGMVLALVGARPVKEGTGRIARFELIPLAELGRPRVDVLCNMSGIFRDAFQNVVELLDDLFARAAAADEDDESNFVAKHARAMQADGAAAAAAARACACVGRAPSQQPAVLGRRACTAGGVACMLLQAALMHPPSALPHAHCLLARSLALRACRPRRGRRSRLVGAPVQQPVWRLRLHGERARRRRQLGEQRGAGRHLGGAQRIQLR